MCTSSLSRINCSIWLDASQRNRDGVWVNRSVREVKNGPEDWILRNIRTCLCLFLLLSYCTRTWKNVVLLPVVRMCRPSQSQRRRPCLWSWADWDWQIGKKPSRRNRSTQRHWWVALSHDSILKLNGVRCKKPILAIVYNGGVCACYWVFESPIRRLKSVVVSVLTCDS